MNSIFDVWAKRFAHYIGEVQKYMQFIFTGHIAIVLVFALGAAGYQYSEWLKVAPNDFPAEWLVAIIVGIAVAFSRPTTLIREPDQVYLLPLETQMKHYFKKAISWTFISQFLISAVLYIIAIPLFKAVTSLSIQTIWLIFFAIIALKLVNVLIEFHYRYANRGQAIWVDRIARMAVSILFIYTALAEGFMSAVLYFFLLFVYYIVLRKKTIGQPVPYEHFVKLEQNRMMSFYRFANYFTDVPHLRGSIRRRAWLDIVYKMIPFNKANAQKYLVYRTFIRTDDHFYLWVRLTAISASVAIFIDIPFVAWIVAGALAFATALQLKVALLSSGEFRMDQLYPVPITARAQAVHQLVRSVMLAQAMIVAICAIGQPLFFIVPIIIIGVGELTLKLSKTPTV